MDEMNLQKIQARLDDALERLADNHSLRDDLDDTQARELLGWATGRLRRAAALAESAGDPDAFMADQVLQLSRLMRQVNGLTPTLVYLVEDDLATELLEGFAGSVAEQTGRHPGDRWLDDVIARRATLNPEQTFRLLLDALLRASVPHPPEAP